MIIIIFKYDIIKQGDENMDYRNMKENERFEAKKCADKLPRSFWLTYSSFANTFGGTIVLGLDEDKDDKSKLIPYGVDKPAEIIQSLWDQLNNPQKVNVNLLSEKDVRVVEYEGKNLIEITIPRAERQRRPVYINGSIENGTYKRNGEGDYLCTMAELSEMLRDASEDSNDSRICTQIQLKDLDKKSVESYRTLMTNLKPEHPWNKETDEEFLRLIGAASLDEKDVLKPTIAGLLMFGFDYSIERELPRYMLDYFEFKDGSGDWTNRMTTDTGEWSGNLFEFYMYVANRLNWNGDRAFSLEGVVRVDDNDLLKAEREAVLNAIAHADYSGSGGIRVELGTDILRIRNPGTFRIPIKLAESGGHSDPRNPLIMKMFMLVGLVDRAGSGVHRMVSACRNLGLNKPTIIESSQPSTVTVELYIRESEKKVPMPTILEYIAKNDHASIQEISKATGISTSTVSRRIRDLKESGRLVREGGRSTGHWKIIDATEGQ